MRQLIGTAIAALMVASGASAQTASLQSAASSLGVADLSAVTVSATGKWYRFAQAPTPSKGWPQYEVTNFTETVDYSAPAAQIDMTRSETKTERNRPLITQTVHEFVSGDYAWNSVAGRPGAPVVTQPQPTSRDARLADIWASPQGFIKAALANKARVTTTSGGADVAFTQGGEKFEGRINAKGEVESVRTWQTNPVLGDMEIVFSYADYRDFQGLLFPGRVVRTQGGFPVWDLTVSDVKRNPSVAISVPELVRTYKASLPPVTILQLAEGVYEFDGGDYNTVAIEQKDRIVVVEAPVDEARSLAVIAKIKAVMAAKPIKYVINTHAHFDQAGGLRTYVAEGATIVTADVNRPFYEAAWKAPHTLQPDRMSQSGKKATFETFSEKHVISDAMRPIEIYPILGSGHSDGFAMVYLPAEKFLFEADAFSLPPENSRPPETPNPYNVNLFRNITRLKLDVRLLAPLQGKVGHMSDLRTAIGNAVVSEGTGACQQEAFYC